MHDGGLDFTSEYVDYRIARDLEEAKVPCARGTKRKARAPAPHPRWVTRTFQALFLLIAVWLILAVLLP